MTGWMAALAKPEVGHDADAVFARWMAALAEEGWWLPLDVDLVDDGADSGIRSLDEVAVETLASFGKPRGLSCLPETAAFRRG